MGKSKKIKKKKIAKTKEQRTKQQNKKKKKQNEVAAKKVVMELEFKYNMQIKGVEVDGQKSKDKEKEDRKDERTKIQASQQSELIEQRQNQSGSKSFESGGNDILGGGFGLGTFDPK